MPSLPADPTIDSSVDKNVYRPQTAGEEIANAITHGIGFLLAIACLVIVVVFSSLNGTAWHVVTCSIYGSTLVLLFLASTLYHCLSATRARQVFRVIDHSSIYLLIAGTYTPFTLVLLKGQLGWTLFALVWGMAIIGIVLKAKFTGRFRKLSSMTYVVMGWLVVFAIKPLFSALPAGGIAWLTVGGGLYTLGVIFYSMTRVKYMHAVWHTFVLGGSLCHFFCILFYIVLRFNSQ